MHTFTRPAALAGLAGAGLLLVAACGSGGTNYGSSPSTGQSPTTTGSVSTGATPFGSVLVDPSRMTLYAFAKDSPGHSACSGSCARYWPPVPGSDKPGGQGGATSAKFGTIERTDGTTQLTVNGFPMYTYAGDSAPGQANGQGKNLSGGLWWVVSPDGSWVKSTSGSSSSSRGGY